MFKEFCFTGLLNKDSKELKQHKCPKIGESHKLVFIWNIMEQFKIYILKTIHWYGKVPII